MIDTILIDYLRDPPILLLLNKMIQIEPPRPDHMSKMPCNAGFPNAHKTCECYADIFVHQKEFLAANNANEAE